MFTENKILKILNYEYDPEVDALYIQVKKYIQNPQATPLNNNIILDLTKEGQIVGLEIINTSHVLKTTMESLENIQNISLFVKVTEYQIFVNAIFTVPVSGHEEIKVTNAITINDINIPKWNANLATA